MDEGGKGRLLYVKGTVPCSAPFSILSAQSMCSRQILGMRGARIQGGPFEDLDSWKEFFLF